MQVDKKSNSYPREKNAEKMSINRLNPLSYPHYPQWKTKEKNGKTSSI